MNYSRVMSETDFSKSSLLFSLPGFSLAFLEVSVTPNGIWHSSGYFSTPEKL